MKKNKDQNTEEELKGVIDLYKTSNPDYEQEKEMLQSILQLNDITVEEIFTHRKNIYSIDSSIDTKYIINKINSSLNQKANIFSKVKSNPTSQNVEEGVKEFNQNNHDGVIAVGGGSGMDTGKGIAFMSKQERPLWDFEDIGDWWTRAISDVIFPIIAVPTTAGTGSETGRASVFTNELSKEKKNNFSS